MILVSKRHYKWHSRVPSRGGPHCPGSFLCIGEVPLLAFSCIFLGCYQTSQNYVIEVSSMTIVTVVGMWDWIPDVTEIMLHWKGKSIRWGKIRKSKKAIYKAEMLEGFVFPAALFFVCLFLRKSHLCRIFNCCVCWWYTSIPVLDFTPGHWAFFHHLKLDIVKANQIDFLFLLLHCCSNHRGSESLTVSVYPYFLVFISCHEHLFWTVSRSRE